MSQSLTPGTKAVLHPSVSPPHRAKMYGLLLSIDGREWAYGAEMTPAWCQLHASYEFSPVRWQHGEGNKCTWVGGGGWLHVNMSWASPPISPQSCNICCNSVTVTCIDINMLNLTELPLFVEMVFGKKQGKGSKVAGGCCLCAVL